MIQKITTLDIGEELGIIKPFACGDHAGDGNVMLNSIGSQWEQWRVSIIMVSAHKPCASMCNAILQGGLLGSSAGASHHGVLVQRLGEPQEEPQ